MRGGFLSAGCSLGVIGKLCQDRGNNYAPHEITGIFLFTCAKTMVLAPCVQIGGQYGELRAGNIRPGGRCYLIVSSSDNTSIYYCRWTWNVCGSRHDGISMGKGLRYTVSELECYPWYHPSCSPPLRDLRNWFEIGYVETDSKRKNSKHRSGYTSNFEFSEFSTRNYMSGQTWDRVSYHIAAQRFPVQHRRPGSHKRSLGILNCKRTVPV
jgi:hypothetical protein